LLFSTSIKIPATDRQGLAEKGCTATVRVYPNLKSYGQDLFQRKVMPGRDKFCRVEPKIRTSFFIGCFICSILNVFLFTPNLHGHSVGASSFAPAPADPSDLTVSTASHKRIDLAWADNSSNEVGFKIERKILGGAYAEIVTLGANVKSYIDSTLSANTEYFYRVRAYNASGFSNYTNEANATTLPNPLVAPSNLTAQVISATQINLAWTDNSDNESGFKIERRLSTATNYALIATVGANTTSFNDTGLAENTKFFYRVRAYNAGGNSSYTTAVSATTPPTAPMAPSHLTAGAVSNVQIDLTWQDQSNNEAGFKIERKTAEGAFAEIAAVGENVTSYSDPGLSQDTPYFYRVRAFNAAGQSGYSNEANATTLPDPPVAPDLLTATVVSKSQINLAWQDNSSNESNFVIERKILQGGTGTYAQIAVLGANLTSFNDTGLSANTMYCYRVRAVNAGGASDYSNEACGTTLPNAPAAPSNLAATVSSKSQINLTWQDNSTNEDSFKIERKTGSAGTYKQIAKVAKNVTSFSSTGLSANTPYFFRVRAYNRGGNSGYSNEASATTLPNAPAAPSVLTATTIGQSQINLAWTDNSINEVDFKIERKTLNGAYAEIAAVGVNVKSYSDLGLAPDTQYFYRVRAANAGGQSNYSNEASATTLPPLPAAPSGLTATTISSSRIDLTWTDNSNNESGFKIERKTGNAGTFAEIATVGANVTSFSSADLNANTKYFYRVRAYNAGGNSAYANMVEATTLPKPPAAPTSLAATAVINLQINLAWSDNSTNEDSFKIERKVGSTGAYAQLATVGPNTKNFSDVGLAPVTTYFYRVRAVNRGGHSGYSNEANATTLSSPPAAPSSATATTMSQSHINLAWTDNATNENGFVVERKTAGDTYTEISSVGPNVKNYSDIGLNADTEYFYRVRAYNAGGYSGYSGEVNAITLPNAPTAPGSLTAAAVSNAKINLAWQDSSDNEAGFKIERKISGGGFVLVATAGANVTSFADSNLAANTTYFYRLRAFNTGGHSNYSGEASATTLPNAPAPPGSLTATTMSKSQINLAWADNATNESGFTIERKIGAAGAYAEIVPPGVIAANVKTYSDINLSQDTQYFYRVRAHNAGGYSGYSNETNAKTLPNPPAKPTSLAAAPLSNVKINLTWTDSSNNEAGFKIERKLGTAGVYAQVAITGPNMKNFADSSGLTPSTPYFYRVRAFNTGGNSNYSPEANATTLPNPPAAPSSLGATAVSTSQINLTWADNSNNESGFRIERKAGATGAYAVVAAVNANVTSYPDTGLNFAGEYFYRVRAFNAGGTSGYTNEINAVTLPLAPGNLICTPLSNKKINLAWADSSGNESGFKIERKLAGGVYALIGTVGANVTSFADSNLTASTTYFYRMRAFNASGNSNYCAEKSAKTLPNSPAAPHSLTVTSVSNRQINVTWTDGSNNESGFRIERKTGAAGTYAVIAAVSANAISYLDNGLSSVNEYFYRVRAFNAGGNSGYTNEVKAVTLPLAPGNLSAVTASYRQINLAWVDSSNNEAGFKIERKISGGFYAEVAAVGANVIGFADSSLTGSTEYFYRVRAFNFGGTSGYTNVANTTTLPNPPNAPDSLVATAVSPSAINLTWRDNANTETGFRIERKAGSGGAYAQIATVGANVTSFFDAGLFTNVQYSYRVRAINAGGPSAPSNQASTVTLPLGPGNLSVATVSQRQLNLTWADSSNNESGFKIERKQIDSMYVEIAAVGANVKSFADSSLLVNTTYFYQIRAFNAGGYSAYSTEASGSTLPNPPNTPDSLSAAVVSNRQVNLTWVQKSDSSNGEAGFIIERKSPQSGANTYAPIATVGEGVRSFADTTLVQKTTYFFRIRAFNDGGQSSYSLEASATTLPNPPNAPSNLTATVAGSSQINLNWSDNSGDEDGFRIESKSGDTGVYTEVAVVSANVTSFSHHELAEDVTYFYRVRAFNLGGNSPASNEVSAIPSDENNFALNRPAIASSTEAGSGASFAVDGDLTTIWNSGSVNITSPLAWLRVELNPSAAVTVDRVVVKWHQTYFAKEYDIQVSSNGTNWTTVYTNTAGAAGSQDLSFTATPAKYARLYMRKNNKASYRVAEFEVYFGLNKARSNAMKNEAVIPDAVTLAQNYPNPFGRSPFNPATTISYALPKGANVTLKVINLTGQEVMTLVEGYKERGIYHVTFNARKLPSGVYYAVLQAGEVRQVRSMVLAK
jgi:titin